MFRVLAASALTLLATVAAAEPRVTFNHDIAPLLQARCIRCHRTDGDAPFSLATYSEARRHATQIVTVTRSRVMPPWKPAPEGGPFIGEQRLTTTELDLLKAWVDEGAVEGAAADLPAPPEFAPDGWKLGTPDLVLAASGQIDAAVSEYRRAVDADPANAEAANNLGSLLISASPEEAVSRLRAALRARPDFPEAHFNLARALTLAGAGSDAVAEYRAALRYRPDWHPALYNLAWLLASHADASIRRPEEAVTLARRVVEQSGKQDALALDLLGAALAAVGRFQESIALAEEAARIAESAGQQELASQIGERLAGYRQQRPFIVN